jgi:hypothetical protein
MVSGGQTRADGAALGSVTQGSKYPVIPEPEFIPFNLSYIKRKRVGFFSREMEFLSNWLNGGRNFSVWSKEARFTA